ncbi:MAG: hypothetical protein ACOYOF_11940, partial [Verrucomicrobiaceae bacterium]
RGAQSSPLREEVSRGALKLSTLLIRLPRAATDLLDEFDSPAAVVEVLGRLVRGVALEIGGAAPACFADSQSQLEQETQGRGFDAALPMPAAESICTQAS